ncbi:MAG: queA [Panacagrimonas sp.]|jgi:S-adenosylmethionine:tRNA ribosyltransferase-isomerase|nr:tRNA preQ1(34) S-adenosylmethionine ribosyltransferase-isomerase QueA [Panacagrimonas sp.]MCC2657070.1 queA [Panacagrimonas sp.]
MKTSDFSYDLPPELIAQAPAASRSASRLLHVGSKLADLATSDLPGLLRSGDLLVFNDTRVIKARLLGHKPTGGRVEILVERVLGEREVLAQIGASKTPKAGSLIALENDPATFEVLGRDDAFFHLRWSGEGTVLDLLERAGRLPLPPYIQHAPDAADAERYQTMFAREPGAVAAPTAGLHFDESLLAALRARGIGTATLTLHVGAGTFQPVRVENLSEHRMHAERYRIPAELAARIANVHADGGRIVAVGTTSVRALEAAAAADGTVAAGEGETRIFITPGYRFRVVDRLVTNFHLPESTLLMLVCAFGGTERMLAAYRHAVAQRYRFFSYGDAMLVEPGVRS